MLNCIYMTFKLSGKIRYMENVLILEYFSFGLKLQICI